MTPYYGQIMCEKSPIRYSTNYYEWDGRGWSYIGVVDDMETLFGRSPFIVVRDRHGNPIEFTRDWRGRIIRKRPVKPYTTAAEWNFYRRGE